MDKLTRERQDALLLHGVVHARIVSRQQQCHYGHRIRLGTTISEDLAAVREALRLDDTALSDLIARGAHRGPWESLPDRDKLDVQPA